MGQILVDLAVRGDALPGPGGDVWAVDEGMHVGGGFNALVAARRMGAEAMARETERPSAAWNVPTSGAREIIAAAIDTDGTTGSCTWTTSKSFSSSQRRVRVIVVGFTEMLATEPLKGTDTEEPADVIHSGRSSEVEGVRTRTS